MNLGLVSFLIIFKWATGVRTRMSSIVYSTVKSTGFAGKKSTSNFPHCSRKRRGVKIVVSGSRLAILLDAELQFMSKRRDLKEIRRGR